jgi:putative FmdB family regulatory protein
MPIYEYLCEKCEHEFEREQRITADPIKTCPKCKSRRVKKLISQTSFVLKGGGWYNDLYSSAKKDNKSDSSEGAKSESGSDKSGDKQDKKEKKEKKGAKGDAGKKSGSKKSSKSAA